MLIEELLSLGWEICLQWIPSHCGIQGNEEADRLAKTGSLKDPAPLDYATTKRLLRHKFNSEAIESFERQAEGKKWRVLLEQGGRIPHNLPRNELVACFRLATGHDYLQAHLARIGVVNSPTCVLCGVGSMTGSHLDECQALLDIQQLPIRQTDNYKYQSILYWTARSRMAERQS
ncbi:uncharacterized protein [Rhodnius prolixus]|uniref:uncharacterized protein n=1 Tax=Rhodnius prolixus TaxID=13249 RepID=UPI003D18BAA0